MPKKGLPMTKKRYDKHSTEFGLWLRKQKEIASSLGYVATNIDYFWKNYKNSKFMLIEEKRYMAKPAYFQHKIFQQLHNAFKNDPNYYGFHLIQFENTNPEDGKTFLDNKEITKEELISFLSFNIPTALNHNGRLTEKVVSYT